jgi:hypothetical protein
MYIGINMYQSYPPASLTPAAAHVRGARRGRNCRRAKAHREAQLGRGERPRLPRARRGDHPDLPRQRLSNVSAGIILLSSFQTARNFGNAALFAHTHTRVFLKNSVNYFFFFFFPGTTPRPSPLLLLLLPPPPRVQRPVPATARLPTASAPTPTPGPTTARGAPEPAG